MEQALAIDAFSKRPATEAGDGLHEIPSPVTTPILYPDVVKEILGACWEMRQMARRKGERRASLRGHLKLTERQLAMWLLDGGACADMAMAEEVAKRMLEAV